MSETIVREKPNSIKVNQNASKKYSFEVKIYFNENETAEVDRVENIYKELHRRFK